MYLRSEVIVSGGKGGLEGNEHEEVRICTLSTSERGLNDSPPNKASNSPHRNVS